MRRNKILLALGLATLIMICCLGIVAVLAFETLTSPSFSALWQQFTRDMANMTDLQQKLTDAYQAEQVQVGTLNGHILRINLINSGLNRLPSSEQAAQAKQVARFAKKNYPGIKTIDMIQVIITEHQQAGILSTNQFTSFSFEATTLPAD